MKNKLLFLYIAVVLVAFSCCQNNSNNKVENSVSVNSDSLSNLTLEVPEVPDSVVGAEERAAFVAEHFWDDLDFAHDSRSLDTAFMEQNFVNFLAVLSVTPEPVAQSAVAGLLDRANASRKGSDLLGYVANRYLDDPNSPMRNEELFILFAREWSVDQSLPEERRARANYRLNQALKNRVGTKGADFAFVDREGRNRRLYDGFGDGMTLLMFYDPDCEQCKAVKEQLSQMPRQEGVRIIAVDTMGDREKWEETKDSFPDDWTVGFATDPIEDDEIYVVRALPTFYLFDKDGTIVLKDPDISQLVNA